MFLIVSVPPNSSRTGLSFTAVCPPVRPAVSRRLAEPQAPEQNPLRTPPSEPSDPSHTSAPSASQHTATGETQTADSSWEGRRRKCIPDVFMNRNRNWSYKVPSATCCNNLMVVVPAADGMNELLLCDVGPTDTGLVVKQELRPPADLIQSKMLCVTKRTCQTGQQPLFPPFRPVCVILLTIAQTITTTRPVPSCHTHRL